MKLLASTLATETEAEVIKPIEKLYLTTDKDRAPIYGQVFVKGGGYWANEELDVYFADRVYHAYADANGRFTKVIPVPAIEAKRTDIKVIGTKSKLSYSISFNIEK